MNGVPLKGNLEAILNDVNRFINIDSDRQEYATHFENLKKILFVILRQSEPFGYLFRGLQLSGSYGDNLKVGKPNEFDQIFHIRFPESSLIKVVQDQSLPGNVHLDFTRVLQKIAKEKQHETNLRYLKNWLNDENRLLVEKLQSYFQSCLTNVLRDMQNSVMIDGKMATLKYCQNGPAHTIHVVGNSPHMKYSVDFVPGILLEESQSVIKTHVGQWEAIPKPAENRQTDYTSFRTSFYRHEQTIMENKYNFKNALRIMKKFRDSHSNMNKMKSYYIKTLFLWKAEKETETYWKKSLTIIIIDMFKAMETSLRNEELPFFWDKRLNMYTKLLNSPRLFRDMLNCVESSRETLEVAASGLIPAVQKRVYRIFLLSNERMSTVKPAEATAIIGQSLSINKNPSVKENSEKETITGQSLSIKKEPNKVAKKTKEETIVGQTLIINKKPHVEQAKEETIIGGNLIINKETTMGQTLIHNPKVDDKKSSCIIS